MPHPVLIRSEQAQNPLGASSAHILPYATIPKPEIKGLCLPGGVLSPHAQAHSLRPGPQQKLVLRMLPVEELKEEHVSRDALGLQAQVLYLQLGHLGVDKDGKLP